MNFFAKFFVSIVVFLLAFLPVWVYLLIRHLISPTGFWQNLALIIVMLLSLWPIQLFLLIILLKCLVVIWFDN